MLIWIVTNTKYMCAHDCVLHSHEEFGFITFDVYIHLSLWWDISSMPIVVSLWVPFDWLLLLDNMWGEHKLVSGPYSYFILLGWVWNQEKNSTFIVSIKLYILYLSSIIAAFVVVVIVINVNNTSLEKMHIFLG